MTARSHTDTTIAAVASPPGVGAIALIRLSGPKAVEIINKLWRGQPLDTPRLARYGRLVNGQGETLDSVLATYFRGPASYTGEDLIEITTHGGTLVTRRVLEALLSAGAVPAAPGEFSQRAFLNGKMDLTQAEAVMDLISAQTDLALRSAQEQLSGRLGEKIHSLRAGLLELLAHIEAHIDFPDEDIDPDTEEALRRRHVQLQHEIEQLLGTADQGRLLREGARVALIGPPNAGKSSLLNWLLGYERAIVSPTAGTTRDFLEERFNLRGMPVRLIDTAGLRGETSDSIEEAGMARTRIIAAEADVVIEMHDASAPRPADFVFTPTASGHVLVLNKVDLGIDPSWREATEALLISCLQNTGLEALLDRLFSHLTQGQTHWGTDPVAINARHQHCLQRAQVYLQASHTLLDKKELPELMALELRSALEAVGDIVGQADTEELLGVIFSSFCIGK